MKIVHHLLLLAVSGLATFSAQAHDNWSVGIGIGNPYPPAYYAPPAVVYAPPPVVIYRHPQSQYYYGAPAVVYPQPAPGFIQFSYGSGGYGFGGPRNFYGGGWNRGRGHGHHHHDD